MAVVSAQTTIYTEGRLRQHKRLGRSSPGPRRNHCHCDHPTEREIISGQLSFAEERPWDSRSVNNSEMDAVIGLLTTVIVTI
jgi:hypothetical protein